MRASLREYYQFAKCHYPGEPRVSSKSKCPRPRLTINGSAVTNLTQTHEFVVAGTTTRIKLVRLPEANFVSAPDVYMSCVSGIFHLSKRITGRGRGQNSPLRTNERLIVVHSSQLEVMDSDLTPHLMTIAIMNNLLFGLADAIHSGIWFREASFDIWNGYPSLHVGHGYLTNRFTPGRGGAAALAQGGAATA